MPQQVKIRKRNKRDIDLSERIKILDDLLINKIAAGEVVERPSSVVKELVENSLDAGSTEISVSIVEGGKKYIKITDNGEGIKKDELKRAFHRHATSKLLTEEDLYHIATMGFRGEALASIASVARVQIKSKEESEKNGATLKVEGGTFTDVTDAPHAQGTQIEVSDLFYNTPVRKKFLRTDTTEYSRTLETLKAISLTNPRVRFKLFNNDKEVFDYKKADFKTRIYDVLGKDVFEKSFFIDSYRAGESGVFVTGVISTPEENYHTNKKIFIFINGRLVKDRSLVHALMQGFDGMIDRGRFPMAVLEIEMPFADVDVNVHPQKTEVRFQEPNFIFSVIKACVRETLNKNARAFASHKGQEGAGSSSYSPSSPPSYEGSGNKSSYGQRSAQGSGQGFGQGDGSFSKAGERSFAKYEGERGNVNRSVATQVTSLDFNQDDNIDYKSKEYLNFEVIGQVFGEYLVVEPRSNEKGKEEFYLIDQHAASERIAFEKLKNSYYNKNEKLQTQRLLLPEKIETNEKEKEVLESLIPHLSSLGFEIDSFGPSSKGGEIFLIKEVPSLIQGRTVVKLIEDLIEETGELGTSEIVKQKIDDILIRIACHSVIRGPQFLTKEEGLGLLREMATVDFSGHCPHGRPVIKSFSKYEIEKLFKRV